MDMVPLNQPIVRPLANQVELKSERLLMELGSRRSPELHSSLPAWQDPRGKWWLSPRLINDPSESCPAALRLHVSPRVRKAIPRGSGVRWWGGGGCVGELCSGRKWCQRPPATVSL